MKLDKLLMTVLVLSLATAGFTLYQRARVEEPYHRIEIIADYEKFKELADDMGMPVKKMLTELREAGITTVAIKEETIEKLRADGLVSAMDLWELTERSHLGNPLSDAIEHMKNSGLDPSGTVVISTMDAAVYERIKEPLSFRGRMFNDWSKDGIYIMSLSGRYEVLKELPLVFDYDKFETARGLGLNIAARPSNYRDIKSGYIVDLFEGFKNYPVTSVIFDGKQSLGYPDELETTARMVKETGIVIGPIEAWMQLKHIQQLGLDNVIKLSGYRAARVFSLDKAEAEKVTPKEIMDRWFRAADERNARLIYINPKIEKEKDPEDNYRTNKKYIDEFSHLISLRGFERGSVSPMKEFSIGPLRVLFLALGVAAGAAMLLRGLTGAGRVYVNGFFILTVLGCLVLQTVRPALADKAFALGAAIVFPSLSMLYVLKYCKKTLQNDHSESLKNIAAEGTVLLIKASAISLIGAAYAASLLSPTQYLLEMDIFRGVKIAHTVPLLVFIVAYFIVTGYKKGESRYIREEIELLLNRPLIIKYAILLSLVAAGGYLYLGRTGHTTGAPILSIEAQIRTFMEQALIARPRTKEFLIAHPAFIIMVMAAVKKYDALILPLGLTAAIGQVSMVNSFCHLRTPLYISVCRTAYGLGFGTVLGIIGVIVISRIVQAYKTYGRA